MIKIFEVIKSLYQDKKPVDVGTVTSEIINRGFPPAVRCLFLPASF